jgi:hypothetical protein
MKFIRSTIVCATAESLANTKNISKQILKKLANNMENLETTIAIFLNELKKNNGAIPTFKIDYNKGCIILTDASSGFLKQIYSNDRVMAHLLKDGIHINYFTKK